MKTKEKLASDLMGFLNSGYTDNEIENYVDEFEESFEDLCYEGDQLSLALYNLYQITGEMFTSDQLEDALDAIELTFNLKCE